MNIRPGMFIKHKNFIDVCCEIKKAYDYGHGISVRVVWWVVRPNGSSYSLDIEQRIDIAKGMKYLKKRRRTVLGDWTKIHI